MGEWQEIAKITIFGEETCLSFQKVGERTLIDWYYGYWSAEAKENIEKARKEVWEWVNKTAAEVLGSGKIVDRDQGHGRNMAEWRLDSAPEYNKSIVWRTD